MPSQQDPKSARCVPDPFLLLGVGSGDETKNQHPFLLLGVGSGDETRLYIVLVLVSIDRLGASRAAYSEVSHDNHM